MASSSSHPSACRPLHEVKAAVVPLPPLPRCKAIARPERQVAARVFREVCDLSRLSHRQLASRIGVDEATFRRWYHGERPIPFEVFLLLPPRSEEGAGVFLQIHAKARAIPTTGEP